MVSNFALIADVVTWALLWEVARRQFRKRQLKTPQPRARRLYQSPITREGQIQEWPEFLRLEYEKAAERYENIYRAIWQNFSYMVVVAGGILTFGAKQLDPPVLYFMALTPLVFWLVATFLPLDHYGDELRARLRQIEREINKVYFPKRTDPRIRHFSRFRSLGYRWRVREAVTVFGRVIALGWLWFFVLAAHHELSRLTGLPTSGFYQTEALRTAPLEIEVRDPLTSRLLDSLKATNGRLDSLISAILSSTKDGRALGARSDTTTK